MKTYDVAVIGAGAAGCMAAIKGGELGKKVALIERNSSIGRKILITGKGRCNITNTAPIDVFIKKFSTCGQFLRTALFAFSNDDLMEFFRSNGLELKVERQGRVFPVNDRSGSVVSVLEDCLKKNNVDIIYNVRVKAIAREADHFRIISEDAGTIEAKKVVVSTGGASYKETGSSGDGFNIAMDMGHMLAPLKPALIPLTAKEKWVKDLQGLGLENVRISFHLGAKKIISDIGEVMFTHFGISGPLVLDLSGDIVSALERQKEVKMAIDLKPGLDKEKLENKLVKELAVKGNIQIKNFMPGLLPKKMVPVFLSLSGVAPGKLTNQVTKNDRRSIINTLKEFGLTVTGSLPIEEAMVTAGGVSTKSINPRTMESRVVPGLYFAGEIIEGAAPSGGYNLQQAFSTGYLAGQKAAS